MSSVKTNIFLTSATGYIGGSVLTALLQHPNASNFNVATLIRSNDERTEKLASLNVTPLVRSIDSFEIIEEAASHADAVIHTAESAYHLSSAQAIVSGLNKRTKSVEKSAVYIHTSGTYLVAEDVRGGKGSDRVSSDLDSGQLYGLPRDQDIHDVDLFIADSADINPLLKTAIVLPPTIYGIGTGLFNGKVQPMQKSSRFLNFTVQMDSDREKCAESSGHFCF